MGRLPPPKWFINKIQKIRLKGFCEALLSAQADKHKRKNNNNLTAQRLS